MKYLLFFALLAFFTCKASAQQISVDQALKSRMNVDEPGLSAAEARKRIGKDVYVVDKVYAYMPVKRKMAVLYLGSKQQKNALIIILKGKDTLTGTQSWIGRIVHVSGKVELYHRRPAIVIASSSQLDKHIQI